ncbi:Rrf2 family transcriptional regulator [Neorhodopirellula pilleata]|uniref:HTH-type transcriptional regulator CymR n=1 Tax=Neorhodopirellula pilleata TaxID=2714738 RepID=A0A5C6ACU1_9BACT|nr:Rrf2 family transcriptional regulator [Neorhodopirellula pilleata]TWT97419.1 HTH-type transcriptional regulator CymR [Neorhodopirellula pilleata]
MVINAAVHYACLAMMDLAIHGGVSNSGDSSGHHEVVPVRSSEIIRRNEIPGPYLVQILRTLKATGWIQAVRGSQGGYLLVVAPDSITLLDIAEAIGCPDSIEPARDDEPSAQRALKKHWRDADEQSRQQLARVRLGDVIRSVRESEEPMFYI